MRREERLAPPNAITCTGKTAAARAQLLLMKGIAARNMGTNFDPNMGQASHVTARFMLCRLVLAVASTMIDTSTSKSIKQWVRIRLTPWTFGLAADHEAKRDVHPVQGSGL